VPEKPGRTSVKYILLEATFVVLGVVLAFSANELREHRNRQRHVNAVLASIREEMGVNRKAVETSLTYHQHLIDTLKTYQNSRRKNGISSADTKPDIGVFSRGFISPASLLATAWDAAKATDALGDMKYEDVLVISRLYAEQERYEGQSQRTSQIIYSEIYHKGTQGLVQNHAHLAEIIYTFIWRERGLLRSYDRAAKNLKRRGTGSGLIEQLPG
jgi:hypothetical protein